MSRSVNCALAILFALLAVACGSDSSTPEAGICIDECPQPGVVGCQGNSKVACRLGDGCRTWVDAGGCQNGCESGECRPGATCDDGCPAEGTTGCQEDTLVSCERGDGCLGWATVATCRKGCQDGGCVGPGHCADACPAAGAKACRGADALVCAAGDTCLEWFTVGTCAGGCADGRCQGAGKCTDACPAEGAVGCIENAVTVCAWGDGCRDWTDGVDCRRGCIDGRCQRPACSPNCEGRGCGEDDGCGGKCTACAELAVCNTGTWSCDCPGVWCDAACCPEGQECQAGTCTGCAAKCDGKQCGEDDGCGGKCTGCPAGSTCNTTSYTCEPATVECVDDRDCDGGRLCIASLCVAGTCRNNGFPPFAEQYTILNADGALMFRGATSPAVPLDTVLIHMDPDITPGTYVLGKTPFADVEIGRVNADSEVYQYFRADAGTLVITAAGRQWGDAFKATVTGLHALQTDALTADVEDWCIGLLEVDTTFRAMVACTTQADCADQAPNLFCGVQGFCEPHPDWICWPGYYGDGRACNCECGAWDPDCDVPTLPLTCSGRDVGPGEYCNRTTARCGNCTDDAQCDTAAGEICSDFRCRVPVACDHDGLAPIVQGFTLINGDGNLMFQGATGTSNPSDYLLLTMIRTIPAGTYDLGSTQAAMATISQYDAAGERTKLFRVVAGTLVIATAGTQKGAAFSATIANLEAVQLDLSTFEPLADGEGWCVASVVLEGAFDRITDWFCQIESYADGLTCDCECGAWDPDCTGHESPTRWCGGTMVCSSTTFECIDAPPCVDDLDCFRTAALDVCDPASGQCVPVVGWTCHPALYGDDQRCNCGCGAWDPDCDLPDADLFCNGGRGVACNPATRTCFAADPCLGDGACIGDPAGSVCNPTNGYCECIDAGDCPQPGSACTDSICVPPITCIRNGFGPIVTAMTGYLASENLLEYMGVTATTHPRDRLYIWMDMIVTAGTYNVTPKGTGGPVEMALELTRTDALGNVVEKFHGQTWTLVVTEVGADVGDPFIATVSDVTALEIDPKTGEPFASKRAWCIASLGLDTNFGNVTHCATDANCAGQVANTVCGPGGFCVPVAGWTCLPGLYDANAGCSCGCGAWDPDCDDPAHAVYCNGSGSAAACNPATFRCDQGP